MRILAAFLMAALLAACSAAPIYVPAPAPTVDINLEQIRKEITYAELTEEPMSESAVLRYIGELYSIIDLLSMQKYLLIDTLDKILRTKSHD